MSIKQYGLPVVMHQPTEATEDKYLAEVPLLKGCRAWGDTPEEALGNLRSVAKAFIRSFKEHGQHPPKAEQSRTNVENSQVVSRWRPGRSTTAR